MANRASVSKIGTTAASEQASVGKKGTSLPSGGTVVHFELRRGTSEVPPYSQAIHDPIHPKLPSSYLQNLNINLICLLLLLTILLS